VHSLAVALSVFSGTCAFALLFAAWVGVGGPDNQDRAELAPLVEDTKRRGWWAQQRLFGQLRSEALRPDRLIRHWRSRPEMRRLTYAGLLCALISLISGLLT
jgi:hypothetical protein